MLHGYCSISWRSVCKSLLQMQTVNVMQADDPSVRVSFLRVFLLFFCFCFVFERKTYPF